MEILKSKLHIANYLPLWLHSSQETGQTAAENYSRICTAESERLLAGTLTTTAKNNKHANRYTDILPFEHNRFRLIGENDYINASYLNTIGAKSGSTCRLEKFIATQGPLPHTILEFWQMVAESYSNFIVMLTQEEERTRVKCARYWPNIGKIQTHEKSWPGGKLVMEVEQIVCEKLSWGKIRDFQIKYSLYTSTDRKSTKTDNTASSVVLEQPTFTLLRCETSFVKQFHFYNWPDQDVSNADQVIDLISLVSDTAKLVKYSSMGPIIVHCSAGCGRTATFCTIYTILSLLSTFELDTDEDLVAKQVAQYRLDRIGSVQTRSQFLFCYDAIVTQLGRWYDLGVPCTWNNDQNTRN